MNQNERNAIISGYETLLVKDTTSENGVDDYRVATVVPYLAGAWFDGSQLNFVELCDDEGAPTMVTSLDGKTSISHGMYLDQGRFAVCQIITGARQTLRAVSGG